jgi:hypothetical protein
MNINIFLLCYNESIMLPKTVHYYKSRFPKCTITIYDNMSTDNSVELAKSLGCIVHTFNTNNINNVLIKRDVANSCWRSIRKGWIIMADMDEWLDITYKDLVNEIRAGTTILTIQGYNMVGESNSKTLDDIDLTNIKKYVVHKPESKNLCFLRPHICSMNYSVGSHVCNPLGIVKYSTKTYINKHMAFLGLPYIINKITERYKRSKEMQKQNYSVHYTDDVNKITAKYNKMLNESEIMN